MGINNKMRFDIKTNAGRFEVGLNSLYNKIIREYLYFKVEYLF
jgi:hypothetical protein